MDYRYSTTITTTPFLQKESSKTFLNVHHYLKNSQINNIITQKIYSLHFSKKLINKHPISIIPKKKRKKKKSYHKSVFLVYLGGYRGIDR